MNMLLNVLSILKKHWQVIALIAVVTAGAGWIKRQQASFAKTLVDIHASHQLEIDKINAARLEEVKEHEQQLKQLQESVKKIQADYVIAQETLKRQQSETARQIVKKYGNDADGLTGLLAERMGFVVVKSTL